MAQFDTSARKRGARVRGGVRGAVVLCTVTLLAQALAAPTAASTPFAPYGDSVGGPAGAVCVLSPRAFLVSAEGPDGEPTTADDQLLHVADVGGVQDITPIHTPFAYRGSGEIARLSATSVLLRGAGDDGDRGTADDVLLFVDGLGSEASVTPIPVGPLGTSGGFTPTILSATSAAVMSGGPDEQESTEDDVILLITDIGRANEVTPLAAPYLYADGRHSKPEALSPTSFLVAGVGPDADTESEDDLVYLFTDVGRSNRRQELDVARHLYYRGGRPQRVGPDRALLPTTGPDGESETGDDTIWLLDDLGGANDLTPITIGALSGYGGGVPCVLSDDLVVMISFGADSVDRTADDELVIISGLGTTNHVDRVIVGGLDEDAQCRPVRLSPTSVALVATGPNSGWEGADDEVIVLSDIGGANRVQRLAVGGLSRGSTCSVRALSATEFVLVSGGPNHAISDQDVSERDDTVLHVSVRPAGLEVTPTTLEGLLAGSYSDEHVPVPLGGGRVALVTAGGLGSNGYPRVGKDGDDLIEIVSGLPDERSLGLHKVRLRFNSNRPRVPARLVAKGDLRLDSPELLLSGDLTVSLGNAAQTIPAGAFARKGKHKLEYRDGRGRKGFIRRLTYDLRKGTWKVRAKGTGTGLETASGSSFRVALDVAELYLADEAVLHPAGK